MPTKPDTYVAAKVAELDRQATFRVKGRAAEFELPGDAARRWKPIFPCFCVQDSPENPCTCPDWPIWWLRRDEIQAESEAGKDAAGRELRYFHVARDSRIMAESMTTVRRGAVRKPGQVPGGVGGVGGLSGGRGGLGTAEAVGIDDFVAGFLAGVLASAAWDAIKWLAGKAADDYKGGAGSGSESGTCYDEETGEYGPCS